MSPIEKARQALAAVGKTPEEIQSLVDACVVDPGRLDRFTEFSKHLDPHREQTLDWALVDPHPGNGKRLIVRSK